MNDAIAAPLQLAQEFGEHVHRLCTGVVKQHDAMVDRLDPLEDEVKLRRW